MKGKEDQLQLTVTVDGTERPFFSQRELEHMVDVRQMVLGAKQMRLVAAALLLLFFLFPKNRRAFLRIVPWGLGSLTAVFALAAWIISRDFTTAWWYFHVLLFSNELWILDPEVDLLVAIVPESFFAACAVRVGVGVVAGILLLWGGCVWWNRRQKRV